MVLRLTILLQVHLHWLILNSSKNVFSPRMKSVQKITSSEVVAIDGKTLCNSYDKASEQILFIFSQVLQFF